ncbi:4591_t:CDS:2 [Funneliformis mosseae]|uniref:4591_t:CDS:1 n=1 Tax=Funneliformis mosseae TaxID=27381 RepID=A0A9N9HCB8_FUNMO|nr:4591_t:CDS:2 [Funneliformis mosseae]
MVGAYVMKIKELEQSNEGLRSQFKYLEEKVRERDEETKANINNSEENFREAKAKQEIINNLEEKIREREEVMKLRLMLWLNGTIYTQLKRRSVSMVWFIENGAVYEYIEEMY